MSDTTSRATAHREDGTDMAETEYFVEGETGAPEGREPERGEDARGRQRPQSARRRARSTLVWRVVTEMQTLLRVPLSP